MQWRLCEIIVIKTKFGLLHIISDLAYVTRAILIIIMNNIIIFLLMEYVQIILS